MVRPSNRPTNPATKLEEGRPSTAARETTAAEKILWDRLGGTEDALTLLRDVGVTPDHAKKATSKVDAARNLFHAVAAKEPNAPPPEAKLAQVEKAILSAEQAVLDLDQTVSMDDFRPKFDEKKYAFSVLARYTRLLASRSLGGGERRDRFEFMATRLLWVRNPDQPVRIRSRAKAEPVLCYILPEAGHVAAPERREAAVAFFQSASKRLLEFRTVDVLLSSGFYLDIYGYKVALKDELLDADVLYAAVVLNVTTAARMDELMRIEPVRKSLVASRLVAQEKEVHRVFGEDEAASEEEKVDLGDLDMTAEELLEDASEAVDQQFRSDRRNARRTHAGGRAKAFPPILSRRFLSQVVMVAAIAAAVYFNIRMAFRDENKLVAVPAAELQTISGYLEAGSYSRGRGHRVFQGRLASSRWYLLSPAERRTEAEKIQRSLDTHAIGAALVQVENQLAIHIYRSQIMYVD